nr:hypothetical protein [Salinibacterium sp.]
MPQLVGSQPGDADALGRVVEPAASERAVAQHSAGLGTHKHMRVERLDLHVVGQLLEDERRNRDGSFLVVFRSRLLEIAVHFDHRAAHLDTSSTEVEVAHAQSGQFTPPQPGVREHEDQKPEPLPRWLGLDGVGKRRNLLMCEELLVRLRLPRQLQPHGRVSRDTPVIDGKLQARREHVDDLPH